MICFYILGKSEVRGVLHIGICDDNQKDISRVQELAVRFSEQHPEMPIRYRLTVHHMIYWMR